MYSLPQLYDPKVVKKIDVHNNKDILGEYADELLSDNAEQEQQPGLPSPLSAGQTSNQMAPQLQKMTPKLTDLMTANPV